MQGTTGEETSGFQGLLLHKQDHCLIKLELHQATGVKADIHKEQPGRTGKPEVESDDENARNINPDTSSEETPTDNPSNNTTEEEPRPPYPARYPARERRAPVTLNL